MQDQNEIEFHPYLIFSLLGCFRNRSRSSDWVRIPVPFQRPCIHVQRNSVIGDLGPTLLEPLHVGLQLADADLFNFPRQHLPGFVSGTDPLELVVILEEEGQILEWNVVLGIAAKLAL